jgi:DNA replication and repair protein RecF
LDSFSRELVRTGDGLIEQRRQLLPRLSPLAGLAFRRIAPETEELALEYAPSVKADFAVELAQARRRENIHRATLVGPHRDDLRLLINNQPAGQFASEGQKRTLAIALKIAQAEFLAGIYGIPPLLLIDDVMGELDQKRRGGFMPLLPSWNGSTKSADRSS